MSEARARSRRLVVALGAAPVEGMLELALHFSGGADAELLGVFVEDERLLEHARAGLAREVLLGGGERLLEHAALERQLRAQSARARQLFETMAARRGRRYAFEVARGHPGAELVRRAAEAEALVVAVGAAGGSLAERAIVRELLRARLRALLLARQGPIAGGTVMAVVDEPAAADRLVAAAARLAEASGALLAVLLTGGARRERERLEAALAGRQPPAIMMIDISGGEAEAAMLARAARSRDVRLLVLRAGRLDHDTLVEELLARTPAALLLLGE